MPAVRRSFRHSPFRCSPWFTLLAVLAFQISTASAKPVMMAAGDVIADIMVPEADGIMGAGGIAKAIGFDGQYLYYAEYAGNVLHRIDVPPPGTSWATGHIDIPIQGAPSGIMTISYDARRGGFWAVGGTEYPYICFQKPEWPPRFSGSIPSMIVPATAKEDAFRR